MAKITKTTEIQTNQAAVRSQPAWKMSLPIDRPCQLYPRVSTPAQKKNVSAEMQQDKAFALQCGWNEDLVLIDSRDLGVSGQLRMEDRLAFNAMNERIAGGEIGAVVVAAVDRLFREKWGVEYSKFMEQCERYGVLVVTQEFVYDFSISWHVDKFRRKCEEAWNYIEYHILGRMLPAREHLAKKGNAINGNLPIGYIIDRSLKQKKPLPYPAHAELVPYPFEVFRDGGGVLFATFQHLNQTGFLFPPFDDAIEDEVRARCSLTKVVNAEGKLVGYKFGSQGGLRDFLCNPVYIGAWVYGGQLIERYNHEAIVEEDLFFYAFEKLSASLLDGSPNPTYTERAHKYAKTRSTQGKGLVREVLEHSDPAYSIYPTIHASRSNEKGEDKITYLAVKRNRSDTSGRTGFPSLPIDTVVIDRLIARLKEENGFAGYQDYDEQEHQRTRRLKRVTEDIISAQAALVHLQEKVKLLTNLDLVGALDEQYTRMSAEVARLKEEKTHLESAEGKEEKRKEYKDLLLQLGERWHTLPAKHLFTCVELFVERVILTVLSPRLSTLTVVWADDEWGCERALCLRATLGSCSWSEEEVAVLATHWPCSTHEELASLLPERSYFSQRSKARAEGLRRPQVGIGEAVAHPGFCLRDKEAAAAYGLSLEEVERVVACHVSISNLVRWSSSPVQYHNRNTFDLACMISRLTSILTN